MKLACKNLYAVYTFTINIEDLLAPVYNLIIDLFKDSYKDKQFFEWIGEIFNIEEVLGSNVLSDDVSEDSFLVSLSNYLEDYLYGEVDLLEKSGILLLYRTKHFIIAPAKSKIKLILTNWIKKSRLIDKFFELINNDNINKIKTTLTKLMNDQYFGESVKVNESELKGTFISKKIIKEATYKEEPIDPESIWLCLEWKEKTGVQESTQFSELSIAENDGYCLCIGDWILPTSYIDQLVKPEAMGEYFWNMLNDVLAKRNNTISIYRDKCTEFATALKKNEFAKLMTNLRYNLYLPKDGIEIPEEFKKFFEEVYNIEEFKDETKQVLFTGNHVAEQMVNKQTMFGLYKTEKDDTEFNLRAWINVENAEIQKLTTGRGVSDIRIKTVFALKPSFSYYFCKDFFEDMFEDMLKECGITYLSNFELYRSDNPNKCFIEIDKMVRKTDGKLVYIENKTTLNKYNIEDTLLEITNFHQILLENYPNVQIEYLLISLYYNKTVEEGFSYFTNIEGNSIKDFEIPIARHNGIKLHCIIEPEYNILKEKMERLLK